MLNPVAMSIITNTVTDPRERARAIGVWGAVVGISMAAGPLVGARVLQGIGASMLNPVAMSIITNTFTEPRERAQAVGVWGAVFGASMALGPVIGGLAVSTLGWPSIFLMNIPVGALAVALTMRFVPESRAEHARRFDPVGQAAVLVMLAGLTFGIIEAPHHGWDSPLVVGSLAAAVSALGVLLAYEPRRKEPLIDLRFFRSAPFSSAVVLSVAAFAAFGGFLFLNTLYLQEVRGLSPVEAGIATAPMAIMTMVMSPISGRLVGRHGPRLPLAIAGAGGVTACLMLTGLNADTPMVWLAAAYAVFGIGFGFVNAPITNAAVSGMPRAQAGVAAAIATTSRQFGQSLGVAVVGAFVAANVGAGQGGDLTTASHPAWWVMGGLGAVVLTLGFLATTCRAKTSARRTALELNPEAVTA
jgi:EmrB/QacA subfamily drug resistance transporter